MVGFVSVLRRLLFAVVVAPFPLEARTLAGKEGKIWRLCPPCSCGVMEFFPCLSALPIRV